MEHVLTVEKEPFELLYQGEKHLKIKRDGHKFCLGDLVILKEIDQENRETGDCYAGKISDVSVLENGKYVVLGF